MTPSQPPAFELRAHAPEDAALARHLRFEPDEGQILLFDQRMLLMHGYSLAELRRELIERLGLDKTRELFTRLGYQQGVEDSRGLRRAEGADIPTAMSFGPRLREVEGFVRNQAVDRMQFDAESGAFWGDYYWQHSWEAETHRRQFGISGTPACWMMVGYACGYTTAMMGRPVIWRETECVAMGHARCRVVGQPIEECHDADELLRFLQVEDFVTTPRHRATRPAQADIATSADSGLPDLVGASAGFNAVVYRLRRVAQTDATVLFLGESGVGKERFTRALRAIGPRADKPFVSVNCAAIPQELVEAELFGVEKGAFTGASAARAGRFERADGGTLFLDEISSLPMHAQGKLLRVLQEGEVERVGDSRVRKVDVRIVAAANCDLRAEVRAGRFREDLFFRLNVFPIEIPPLRERREDIPLLVNVFLQRYAERFGKRIAGLTRRASDALWSYDWPGNVRELENMIERGVILADDDANVDVQHLFSGGEVMPAMQSEVPDAGAAQDASMALAAGEAMTTLDRRLAELLELAGSFEGVESLLMAHALRQSGGNASAAARLLGLGRGQFEYRRKKRQGQPG
ncbi:sigma 54-interacting transcriptional regulator [Azoarcus sp. L1K30]|uniref:sigma-54-dependent Fis family transcriptional regulator n=1 Tax=Azoarcus sp. L1K30 TaxID=2820277 RepID=UPI001B81C6E9|nr:sigma-54-dependent Fis family transcriptional regulator [Azoarcus sp. L1K30]MBR0565628.1 sigma 54-interacting transcriptional regulator [Azoarcus sp. L1K30]